MEVIIMKNTIIKLLYANCDACVIGWGLILVFAGIKLYTHGFDMLREDIHK